MKSKAFGKIPVSLKNCRAILHLLRNYTGIGVEVLKIFAGKSGVDRKIDPFRGFLEMCGIELGGEIKTP